MNPVHMDMTWSLDKFLPELIYIYTSFHHQSSENGTLNVTCEIMQLSTLSDFKESIIISYVYII